MKREKQKKNRFAKGLALFWAAGLVMIAVGLGWLWTALDRYESSTPEAAVRAYLGQVARGEWDTLYAQSGFDGAAQPDAAEYAAYLKTVYKTLPEEPRLVRTGEEGGTVYQLCGEDGRQIARLELTQAPEGEKYAYRVRTKAEFLGPIVVELPQGVQVLADGQPLPESALQGEETAKGYEELPEGQTAPLLLRYELTGRLTLPELTLPEGQQGEYALSGPDETGEALVYRVSRQLSPQQQEEASALAQRAAKTYAAFVTQDATRGELNAFLLPGTPFYRSMQQFYNGWYVEHTGYDYRNVVCDELGSAGENAFSARVSFDYVVLRGAKEYLYPSSYRLYFLKTGQGWQLVRLDTL